MISVLLMTLFFSWIVSGILYVSFRKKKHKYNFINNLAINIVIFIFLPLYLMYELADKIDQQLFNRFIYIGSRKKMITKYKIKFLVIKKIRKKETRVYFKLR